jgi:hypothetical protein
MKSRTLMRLIAIAALATPTIWGSLAAQDATTAAKKPQHHHYKLIDMGTFGGPESYVNETVPAVTASRDINLQAMVGSSATSTPTTGTSSSAVAEGWGVVSHLCITRSLGGKVS